MYLPAAIRYGIPYETFWHLNPRLLMIYQDEYIKRKKEQAELLDRAAWLFGSYNVNAVQAAIMPRKVKYVKQPQSQRKAEELSGAEKFKAWAVAFNAQHEELPEYGEK